MKNEKKDRLDDLISIIITSFVGLMLIVLMINLIVINQPSFETKREKITNITFKSKPKDAVVIETDKRTVVKRIGFGGISWEKSDKQKEPIIEYMVDKNDSTDERKMKIIIPPKDEKKYSKEYAEVFSRTLVIKEREKDK